MGSEMLVRFQIVMLINAFELESMLFLFTMLFDEPFDPPL